MTRLNLVNSFRYPCWRIISQGRHPHIYGARSYKFVTFRKVAKKAGKNKAFVVLYPYYIRGDYIRGVYKRCRSEGMRFKVRRHKALPFGGQAFLKGSIVVSLLREQTLWHTKAHYLPTLASKTSLIEESRLFLLSYAQTGDIRTTSEALLNGVLTQRSRATRATIVSIIRKRLVQWLPPEWVLTDLVAFAQDTYTDALKVALLLHGARQDMLLYDFVQQVLVPCWQGGMRVLVRSDVQRFLDEAQESHTEILRWSHSTREKLASNVLTVLRDYGLLNGDVYKRIIVPIVPTRVVAHLVRLLQAEGVEDEKLALHPDWRLWLWGSTQAQYAINEVVRLENHEK